MLLGAGAVGGSIGGLLAASGQDTLFIARGPHGDALEKNGLRLCQPGKTTKISVAVNRDVSEVDWRPGDVAFLATKLQDAEVLLDQLRDTAGEQLVVVCAVNGTAGERWASERFETVLSMLVWLPATHLVPGEVRLHALGSPGVLDTGAARGDEDFYWTKAVCACLRRAGFEALPRRDIVRWKNAKWISNLGGTAQALILDDWSSVAAAARAEGEQVLAAAGIERVPLHELMDRVKHVGLAEVDGKAREGGSIWQSHARGRSLETPWIEGAMAELGARVDVPTPVNALLARAAQTGARFFACDALRVSQANLPD